MHPRPARMSFLSFPLKVPSLCPCFYCLYLIYFPDVGASTRLNKLTERVSLGPWHDVLLLIINLDFFLFLNQVYYFTACMYYSRCVQCMFTAGSSVHMMYSVHALAYVLYLSNDQSNSFSPPLPSVPPLLSFPWLFLRIVNQNSHQIRWLPPSPPAPAESSETQKNFPSKWTNSNW